MDYEQKYKEALERVRKLYNDAKANEYKSDMEDYESIFPELAESEDERIRKCLCDIVNWLGFDSSFFLCNGVAKTDVLAYLEKQKEQKPGEIPPYVTGIKGEPDPAGTSDLEEAAEKYIQGSMCDLDDGPSTGLAKESFIAGAKWQKEQKPAEWSEEDEKDMAHIIRILDDCYVYGTHDLSKTDHENLVNKLKSLRPSWKPNEEQMKALNEIVNILAESPFLHQNDYLFNILNGLREELKKLL